MLNIPNYPARMSQIVEHFAKFNQMTPKASQKQGQFTSFLLILYNWRGVSGKIVNVHSSKTIAPNAIQAIDAAPSK